MRETHTERERLISRISWQLFVTDLSMSQWSAPSLPDPRRTGLDQRRQRANRRHRAERRTRSYPQDDERLGFHGGGGAARAGGRGGGGGGRVPRGREREDKHLSGGFVCASVVVIPVLKADRAASSDNRWGCWQVRGVVTWGHITMEENKINIFCPLPSFL